MASDFQSSFIPKEPVTKDGFSKSETSLFGIIGLLLFLVVLAATGGLFAYQYVLKGEINTLQSQLASAESSIDKKSISDMSAFSKKLNMVKTLVDKHRVISAFLDDLASSTVSTVQFDEFSFGPLTESALTVTIRGQTTSYASIALQEKVFDDDPYILSTSFSDLSLREGGRVGFSVKLNVDRKIVNYVAPAGFVVASSTPDDLSDMESSAFNEDLDFNLNNI